MHNGPLKTDFWELVPLSVDYHYPNRPAFEGCRLRSARFEQMLGERFPVAREHYYVDSMEGVDHGRHSHPGDKDEDGNDLNNGKNEVMLVLRGAFRFVLLSPDNMTRLELELSEDSGYALFIHSGARHWVRGLKNKSLLSVNASTMHNDDNPDVEQFWPVDLFPQDVIDD